MELQEFEIAPSQQPAKNENNQQLANRLAKLIQVIDFSDLNDEERASLLGPLTKFPYRFRIDEDILGASDVIEHQIHTTDEIPTFQRQYRPAQAHNEEILNQTRILLNTKFIEDSDSPYNSPVWIVPKRPIPKE